MHLLLVNPTHLIQEMSHQSTLTRVHMSNNHQVHSVLLISCLSFICESTSRVLHFWVNLIKNRMINFILLNLFLNLLLDHSLESALLFLFLLWNFLLFLLFLNLILDDLLYIVFVLLIKLTFEWNRDYLEIIFLLLRYLKSVIVFSFSPLLAIRVYLIWSIVKKP